MNKNMLRVIGICILTGVFLITSGKQLKAIIPTQSTTALTATEMSECRGDQLIYTILLKIKDINAAKYIIERQNIGRAASRVKVLEWTSDEMVCNQFQYLDYAGLVKHGRYQYILRAFDSAGEEVKNATVIAVVENIQYKDDPAKFIPVISQNNATFTLGPKVDPENEALEYRLYIRVPGGGGERIYQSWCPQNNNERVSVNLSDTCEFKLVCLETMLGIPDRGEAVLLDWYSFEAER